MFVLSRAASISSRTKKGDGFLEWIANNRAKAAIVFSPPLKLSIGLKRFPGATQLYETPSKYGSS